MEVGIILLLIALLVVGALAMFVVGYTLGLSRMIWRRMSLEERVLAVLVLTAAWLAAIVTVASLTGGL